MNFVLNDERDTERLAKLFAQLNPMGSLWLLGDLGVGKTTFVRYFLRALGYGGAVKSPTYTLVEPYVVGDKRIYHADLYRLQDAEELDFIGFFEYFDEPNALVIIEWASRASGVLPKPQLVLNFDKSTEHRTLMLMHESDNDLSVLSAF